MDHVLSAVKFAAKHNVRLSIINAGHDFLGRCVEKTFVYQILIYMYRNDAPSGLLISVGGMKGIRILESFVATPEGAKPVDSKTAANVIRPKAGKQAAITIGAGINALEINTALLKSGLIIPTAAHSEVAVAGGWAQGGGHSYLSSEFGLGADLVLEYKVVTADGNLVVANAVSNPDLFWALRGGGGGTFGVVVEATFKASLLRYSTSISSF